MPQIVITYTWWRGSGRGKGELGKGKELISEAGHVDIRMMTASDVVY